VRNDEIYVPPWDTSATCPAVDSPRITWICVGALIGSGVSRSQVGIYDRVSRDGDVSKFLPSVVPIPDPKRLTVRNLVVANSDVATPGITDCRGVFVVLPNSLIGCYIVDIGHDVAGNRNSIAIGVGAVRAHTGKDTDIVSRIVSDLAISNAVQGNCLANVLKYIATEVVTAPAIRGNCSANLVRRRSHRQGVLHRETADGDVASTIYQEQIGGDFAPIQYDWLTSAGTDERITGIRRCKFYRGGHIEGPSL
jgi:hypothetical protein